MGGVDNYYFTEFTLKICISEGIGFNALDIVKTHNWLKGRFHYYLLETDFNIVTFSITTMRTSLGNEFKLGR